MVPRLAITEALAWPCYRHAVSDPHGRRNRRPQRTWQGFHLLVHCPTGKAGVDDETTDRQILSHQILARAASGDEALDRLRTAVLIDKP
jgi:hypothetical protein